MTIGVGKTASVTLTVPAGTQSGKVGCAMVFSGPPKTSQNYWPVTVIAQ
jgi:hypothetical protein